MNSSFIRLKQYIIDNTGLNYYADKDGELESKVRRRMATICVKTMDGYFDYLTNAIRGPSEFDDLVSDLTIGETHFYRENKVIEGLKDFIIPDLLLRNRDSRQLRIWSAGCATGEECYTISIILKRYFSQALSGWDIQIIGTDVNRDFLARAREGVYSDWSFRETPADIKRECFTGKANKWQIKPEFMRDVTFLYHNLVKHPFPSLLHNLISFDAILCRNVMIYFTRELALDLIRRFKQSLRSQGWLVVGHADHTIELTKEFETINASGASLYWKGHEREPDSRETVTPIFTLPPFEAQQAEMNAPPVVDFVFPTEAKDIPAQPPPASDRSQTAVDMDLLFHLANQGDFSNALAVCEKLLETNLLDPIVHFYHALIMEHFGDYSVAEKSLRKSIYLDRHFVLGHYHLGLFLQNKGDLMKARKSFETVSLLLKDINPEHRFPNADDIKAGQLKELTGFHIEVLERL